VAESPSSGAITCQALARQATEFIEGRLAAESRIAIEQHLMSCAACTNYVNQLRLVRDSLRDLPDAQTEKKRNTLTEHFVRTMRNNKKP
jgi:anti-sigma factor RsiW